MNKAGIIERIRYLCDSEGNRERNCEETGKLFLQLANHYHSKDWRSFICKDTLLNAALVRHTDPAAKTEIESQIRELGKELLAKCNAEKKNLDLLEISRKIRNGLDSRRSIIEGDLRKIDKIPYDATGADLEHYEKDRIQTMRFIMGKVSNFYLETMREVSAVCLEALGKPPCGFSHFAMGSLAREEATLYSDFENAILLEDSAVPDAREGDNTTDVSTASRREEILQFFRWYAVLFHVILINFGQTPIHMVGIEGLNDQYSTNKADNWFYDCFTEAGITFDSFLPYASKTPLGREPTSEKPFKTELILPVREMLEFLGKDRSLKEGYHLSDMLLESRYVTGDERMYDRFKQQSVVMMSELRKFPDYIENAAKNAKDDLKKFDLTPEFATLGWTQNAKKLYYRPMSVYIPWLARTCGVLGSSNSFDAVEALVVESGSCLSQAARHNILYALSVANQLRLEVYGDRSKASDTMAGAVHLVKKSSHIMTVFDAVGDRSALDCYEVSLGLRAAVVEILDDIHLSIAKSGTIDERKALTVLDKHVRSRGNLKLHGDIYRHFQNYSSAIACYENALQACRSQMAADDSHEREIDILMALGLTNLYSLKFWESVTCYQNAIQLEKAFNRNEMSKYNIAMACTMMGQCYTEMPPRRANFAPCMEEGIRLWEELISTDPKNEDYIKGMAEARDTEGFYFLRTRHYESSMEKYGEAAKLFEEFNGKGVITNDTMKVQNGIAMCLLGSERYEEAANMFDKIIYLKQSVIGKEVADVNVSWYLRSKGDALKNLGKFDEAIESYKLSIEMREAAPGSEYDKYAAMGNTACRLADCYYRCGKYDEVLQTVDEILLLANHIPNSNRGKEYLGKALQLKRDVEERSTEVL